jgi:uncharacterized repeat protein (TIGR02543 family)
MKAIKTLLASLFSVFAAAGAAAAQSGDSGGCSWAITGSGSDLTLTISKKEDGNGAMANYANVSAVPWYGQAANLKTLVIEAGVTSIGSYAFQNHSFTGELTIPEGVTTIGVRAFSGCAGFTSHLTIPEGVTTIGDRAFSGCLLFDGVTIPTTVTSISASAFISCTGFLSVISLRPTPPPTWWEFYQPASRTLFVPCEEGAVAAYKEDANWGKFTSIRCGSYMLELKVYGAYNVMRPTSGLYPEDTTLTLTARGYSARWWSGNNDLGDADALTLTLTQDTVITAYIELKEYDVSYVLSEGVNHPDNPATFTVKSEAITLQDAYRENRIFAGWYTDAGFSESGKVTGVAIPKNSTGDKTFYAKWETVKHKITYYNVEGATNPNPDSFTVENEITLNAPDSTGYEFKGWYANADLSESSKVIGVAIPEGATGDTAFYAKWDTIKYRITYHNVAGATHANPDSFTVESAFTLQDATDSTGYEFLGWYTSGNFSDGSKATGIARGSTGEKDFYAKWDAVSSTPDAVALQSLTISDKRGLLQRWEYGEIGDAITYEMPCGNDSTASITIAYTTPPNVTAKVVPLDSGITQDGDQIVVNVGKPGLPKSVAIDLNSDKRYVVNIKKPYQLFDLITEHLGNLRVLINNPEYNGGLRFASCDWWQQKEGKWLLAEHGRFYYSAGPHATDLFKPEDSMFVRLYTVDGDTIETCSGATDSIAAIANDKNAAAESNSKVDESAYPNPVMGGEKLYLKDAVLFDKKGERFSTFRLYSSHGQLVSSSSASAFAEGITMPNTPGSYYLILDGRAGRRAIHIAVVK